MLTDPPIRRSVMLLCFGAAGFLLAAEWRMLRSQFGILVPLQPSRIGRIEMVLKQSPVAGIVRQTKIVIRLRSRKLELFEADKLIKTYDIAVGQDDWETPIGYFTALDLQKDPLWQHPITGEAVETGPDNPLGTRWIGFAYEDGFPIGIHGTNQEELVGQAVSHGCVRMRDHEIQEVFAEVAIGTPIVVRPD
ncbi:L,D-transpeptidase [Oscillatoria sp. CS-180]|uniref:L,D-transpeptidase n=1 Tax=Oscillatoria sp. CS-180 TaxID=3021720 RepID=UPI00232CAB88|nr:L,D-transpeptidase [Oscillatoria sp. CS-180]MDB9526229.1 L,D-transpeptidase [Oscillatoria sp. CS-180]